MLPSHSTSWFILTASSHLRLDPQDASPLGLTTTKLYTIITFPYVLLFCPTYSRDDRPNKNYQDRYRITYTARDCLHTIGAGASLFLSDPKPSTVKAMWQKRKANIHWEVFHLCCRLFPNDWADVAAFLFREEGWAEVYCTSTEPLKNASAWQIQINSTHSLILYYPNFEVLESGP
jgi:hypothetical protein